MTTIKLGLDGWQTFNAKDFTVGNVGRVAEAAAQWLLKYKKPSVVLGHHKGFGGELLVAATCNVLARHGIKVFLAKGFVSTQMVCLGTVKKIADLGIIITASHNPSSYTGFILKGACGEPLLSEKIEEIENLISERNIIGLDNLNMEDFEVKGLIEHIDLESIYYRHIEVSPTLQAFQ